MSGSPVIDEAGRAVAIVTSDYQEPGLAHALPRWLVDELVAEEE